ncbi:Serine/threonine-protein kinase, partial [Quaeritorhiza haematococci]
GMLAIPTKPAYYTSYTPLSVAHNPHVAFLLYTIQLLNHRPPAQPVQVHASTTSTSTTSSSSIEALDLSEDLDEATPNPSTSSLRTNRGAEGGDRDDDDGIVHIVRRRGSSVQGQGQASGGGGNAPKMGGMGAAVGVESMMAMSNVGTPVHTAGARKHRSSTLGSESGVSAAGGASATGSASGSRSGMSTGGVAGAGAGAGGKASLDEYVVVEKRVVEVNWLADEVAAAAAAAHTSRGTSTTTSSGPHQHSQSPPGPLTKSSSSTGIAHPTATTGSGSGGGGIAAGVAGGIGGVISAVASKVRSMTSSPSPSAVQSRVGSPMSSSPLGAGAALMHHNYSQQQVQQQQQQQMQQASPMVMSNVVNTNSGGTNSAGSGVGASSSSGGGAGGSGGASASGSASIATGVQSKARILGSLRESTHQFLLAPQLSHAHNPQHHRTPNQEQQQGGNSNTNAMRVGGSGSVPPFVTNPAVMAQMLMAGVGMGGTGDVPPFCGTVMVGGGTVHTAAESTLLLHQHQNQPQHAGHHGGGHMQTSMEDHLSLLTTLNLCALRAFAVQCFADEVCEEEAGVVEVLKEVGLDQQHLPPNTDPPSKPVEGDSEAGSTTMEKKGGDGKQEEEAEPVFYRTALTIAEEALNLYLAALGLYQLGMEVAKAVWEREREREREREERRSRRLLQHQHHQHHLSNEQQVVPGGQHSHQQQQHRTPTGGRGQFGVDRETLVGVGMMVVAGLGGLGGGGRKHPTNSPTRGRSTSQSSVASNVSMTDGAGESPSGSPMMVAGGVAEASEDQGERDGEAEGGIVNLASLSAAVQWIRDRFNQCLEKAEICRHRISMLTVIDEAGNLVETLPHLPGKEAQARLVSLPPRIAERLLYDRALEVSHAAAIKELRRREWVGCEGGYRQAILLLEALLSLPSSIDEDDEDEGGFGDEGEDAYDNNRDNNGSGQHRRVVLQGTDDEGGEVVVRRAREDGGDGGNSSSMRDGARKEVMTDEDRGVVERFVAHLFLRLSAVQQAIQQQGGSPQMRGGE